MTSHLRDHHRGLNVAWSSVCWTVKLRRWARQEPALGTTRGLKLVNSCWLPPAAGSILLVFRSPETPRPLLNLYFVGDGSM